MNIILRCKITALIIATSIHFIYSGCCGCCGMGKGSKSCNKSNSKGKPSSQDAGKPGNPGKPDTGEKPEEIPVVETSEDKKKADEEKKRNLLVCNKISEYLNTRDGNRVGIDTKIKFHIKSYKAKNGFCVTFTNGIFAGLIKNDEINKINEVSNNDLIGSLKITIQIHNNNKKQTYNFTNNECTLEQLVKSLNVLDKNFRAKPTEYLFLKNEAAEEDIYINLENGIAYYLYPGAEAKIGSSVLTRDYAYATNPLYYNGNFYEKTGFDYKAAEDQIKAAEEFNKPLSDNDIDEYILTIASKN